MPIHFDDVDSLLQAVGLPSQATVRAQAGILAHLARAELMRLAKERLKTSERAYTGGILPITFEGRKALLILEGMFPNMVEHGWPAHDLRTTVLKSAKARVSKAGHRYLAIPFRVMMPGATGRNAEVLGVPYERSPSFAGRMTSAILQRTVPKEARALSATTSTPGGGTSWGGRLPATSGGPLARPRHATGLYSALMRFGKGYGGGSGARYGTFRMISTNPASMRSDLGGNNWMHPGIQARHLMRLVRDYIRRMTPVVLGQRGGQ